jgi:hypothetical protein
MASELPAATGISLTLTQLARPLRRGSQYMFAQLSEWRAPLTPELISVLEAGLFADEVKIACAAAPRRAFPEAFAAMGATALVDRAWQHWLEHEEPIRNQGAIPNSPQAVLTRALISLGGDSDVIDRARSDSRHDVRDIAKARFRKLVTATPEGVDAFQPTSRTESCRRTIWPRYCGKNRKRSQADRADRGISALAFG